MLIPSEHVLRGKGDMTVASTAKRRRRQAVNNFRHMAVIGHGNNNRPLYAKRSLSTLERREKRYRERQGAYRARQAAVAKSRQG